VAKYVYGDILGLASPREAVGTDAGATSGSLDDVVDPLASHPTSLLAWHQSGAVVASLEKLSKRRDGPQRVVPIELESHEWRDAVVGVVLLDRRREPKQLVLGVEHLTVHAGELATAEPGVVEERDDRVVTPG